MRKHQVLIVGGGAAGLRAAQLLTQAGRRVTIIEARDRLGGRIHTLRSDAGPPVEGGPEFVHGDSPEMDRLLKTAGIQPVELPDRHWRILDGRPQTLDFEAVWARIGEKLNDYAGPDCSFADFLATQVEGLPDEHRTAALDYVEGFNAADARQVGIEWLRKTEAAVGAESDAGVQRIVTGYREVTESLAESMGDVPVHLNTRVTKIHWQPGHVTAEALEGETPRAFVADCAVITLPLGVLQSDAVEFSPALPEKRAAANQLRMGAVVKVVFRLQQPLSQWGFKANGFLHLAGKTFLAWWPLGDSPLLTGWSGGPRAEAVSALSDEEITATAVHELTQALSLNPEDFRRQIAAVHVFNWQRDPLSRGAYAYAAVGGANAPQRLAEPVADTLFFAGEATDAEFMGTVTGALRSGRRAAEQVLA